MKYRQPVQQILIIIIIQSITIVLLGLLLPGLVIESMLPAIGIVIIFLLSQSLYWRLFILLFFASARLVISADLNLRYRQRADLFG